MKKILCMFLVLSLLLAGCGAKSSSSDYYQENSYMEAPSATMAPSISEAAGKTDVTEGRKWIVTVSMSTETEDLDGFLLQVEEQVRALGGYLEDQSVYNSGYYYDRNTRRANVTVRVPVSGTESFTSTITGISNVTSSSKNMEDVTLRYVATESRVNALKTEEGRLLEMMEKAENLSDLLQIESRLTDVRYELENITSQLRVLANQVDFATIILNVTETKEFTPVEEPSFGERIVTGFKANLQNLMEGIEDFTVWFLTSLPTLIVWGIILWGVITVWVKIHRKRKIKKAARKAEKEE